MKETRGIQAGKDTGLRTGPASRFKNPGTRGKEGVMMKKGAERGCLIMEACRFVRRIPVHIGMSGHFRNVGLPG
jgi:hypothetical protein